MARKSSPSPFREAFNVTMSCAMGKELTPKQAPTARRIAVDIAIMTLLGLLMAILGPFGSFELPFAIRLIYWLALGYVGYAVYRPMGLIVDRLHRRLELSRGWLWVTACLLATIPMSVIVYVVGFLPGPIPMPDADTALRQYVYVLAVGGAVTLLFVMLEKQETETHDVNDLQTGRDEQVPEPTVMQKEGVRLVGRLSPPLGSDILAVENEDHYVRVHTALGSELILMRLGDAVEELGGIDGIQVHRGWWVARHAVEDVRREGRNIRLVLPGGIEAPVSRANVQVLKDAGWL
ncbi:LytTR family DNA-binding domain-containing protein [Altererythrobacter sp. MF3-039]|uniref:LytTR family DNA-binding domain-containing protein n=1 Tax=Altererythrobacter sp. MF3-039 TaxID=3252901 RepID=UPI00390CA62A